jgi:hypothetical protein
MSDKKFIGSGFPGIRECFDEKNVMTKESREKREFSVRNIIPINQILSKRQTKGISYSEEFNVRDNVEYSAHSDSLNYNDMINQTKFTLNDLELINAPIKKVKKQKGSEKQNKKGSEKQNKKGSRKQKKGSEK